MKHAYVHCSSDCNEQDTNTLRYAFFPGHIFHTSNTLTSKTLTSNTYHQANMSEYSLTEIVISAVEDLAWPLYHPHLLKKFQTLAIFLGFYDFAFLCNIQHWITGISDIDGSLDMVMNMKMGMDPEELLSLAMIGVGVAARNLIILNLVYLIFLVMVEALAQNATRILIRDMKNKKKRSGGEFQTKDVNDLRALMRSGAWAQDQLLEQSPGVNLLVKLIYEKLGVSPVEDYFLEVNCA